MKHFCHFIFFSFPYKSIWEIAQNDKWVKRGKKLEVIFEFLLKDLLQPQLWAFHEFRTESEHQNTELQLIERPITVKVTFHKHGAKILITEALKAKKGRISLEAVKGDNPFFWILQKIEAIA